MFIHIMQTQYVYKCILGLELSRLLCAEHSMPYSIHSMRHAIRCHAWSTGSCCGRYCDDDEPRLNWQNDIGAWCHMENQRGQSVSASWCRVPGLLDAVSGVLLGWFAEKQKMDENNGDKLFEGRRTAGLITRDIRSAKKDSWMFDGRVNGWMDWQRNERSKKSWEIRVQEERRLIRGRDYRLIRG